MRKLPSLCYFCPIQIKLLRLEMANLLDTPIEYLKGVGPQRGDLLRKELSIQKYSDLINLFPNRYIDRTRYYKINQ